MWNCCSEAVLWLVKVEKAGATALFQQEGKGSNNIGVVVNPVRLNSLAEFGTPQFVADRLLQAEKKKVEMHERYSLGIATLQCLRSGRLVSLTFEVHYLYGPLMCRSGFRRFSLIPVIYVQLVRSSALVASWQLTESFRL